MKSVNETLPCRVYREKNWIFHVWLTSSALDRMFFERRIVSSIYYLSVWVLCDVSDLFISVSIWFESTKMICFIALLHLARQLTASRRWRIPQAWPYSSLLVVCFYDSVSHSSLRILASTFENPLLNMRVGRMYWLHAMNNRFIDQNKTIHYLLPDRSFPFKRSSSDDEWLIVVCTTEYRLKVGSILGHKYHLINRNSNP